MYEDEYYYEARKKENAKLDAELAGTFATVIGGLIGAVLSCLIFLLRRFDVLSSGLASLLFYMLTYTREWHVAIYITVAFVIFIASMILQHAFLAGRIIFTIFVSIAVAIIVMPILSLIHQISLAKILSMITLHQSIHL
jgi:uncharacterized membrane protein YjjP (DUF1212 family)